MKYTTFTSAIGGNDDLAVRQEIEAINEPMWRSSKVTYIGQIRAEDSDTGKARVPDEDTVLWIGSDEPGTLELSGALPLPPKMPNEFSCGTKDHDMAIEVVGNENVAGA